MISDLTAEDRTAAEGALLMQLISATLIKHDLPDSTARMIAAAIIIAAVYLQRTRVAT